MYAGVFRVAVVVVAGVVEAGEVVAEALFCEIGPEGRFGWVCEIGYEEVGAVGQHVWTGHGGIRRTRRLLWLRRSSLSLDEMKRERGRNERGRMRGRACSIFDSPMIKRTKRNTAARKTDLRSRCASMMVRDQCSSGLEANMTAEAPRARERREREGEGC